MAFIISLLVPGIENLRAVGMPFYVIIAPTVSLKMKLLCLTIGLSFLLVLTQSQVKPITGGDFRDYLDSLFIPSRVHKYIDLIILLLSLNLVWLAIFIGVAKISQIANDSKLLCSYYSLYFSMVIAIVALLLNSLYQNILNVVLLILALILITLISTQKIWLLNISVALFISLLSVVLTWNVEPYKRKTIINRRRVRSFTKECLPQVLFLMQLATYRAHKSAFFLRIALCFILSIFSCNLFFSDAISINRDSSLLILIGLESYILSTLMVFFAKSELEYSIFHFLFSEQLFAKRLLELIVIIGALILSLLPLILSFLLKMPSYIMQFTVLIALNILTIIFNRIFYTYSLRFCFFTSLLNTLGNMMMDYLLIGALFGN